MPTLCLQVTVAALFTILLLACLTQSRVSEAHTALRDLGVSANRFAPRYVYVSDPYGDFVDEFDWSGHLVAKITSGLNGPVGVYVDGAHNLWVANTSGGNVLMFAEGAITPSRTLQDIGAIPSDVTIGSDGTAYVANIFDASGPGSILVYPPGHDTPTRRLQDPLMQQNLFITIDAAGDLFVTTAVKGLPQFVGRVDEYIGARQSGLRNFHIKLGSPGGIKWWNGMLYVCDTTKHTISEYTEAGRPTGRRLVTGGAWDGIDVSADGTTMVGADQTFLQGIARTPWRGNIRGTFVDPAFQSPVGIALQTDQKGL